MVLFKDPYDLGVSWSYFVLSFLGRGLITIPRCSHCGNNNLLTDPCLWKGRIFSLLGTEFQAWAVGPSQKGRSCGKHFKLATRGPHAHRHGLFFCLFCVSCKASVIAHNWSQSYMKVRLISTWLGVGYSPAPAARTAPLSSTASQHICKYSRSFSPFVNIYHVLRLFHHRMAWQEANSYFTKFTLLKYFCFNASSSQACNPFLCIIFTCEWMLVYYLWLKTALGL